MVLGLPCLGSSSLANAREPRPAPESHLSSCAADSDGHCIPGVANPASPQGSGAGLCLCPSNHPVLELAPVSVGAEFGIGALQFVVGGLGAVGAGLGSLFLTRGNDAAIPLSMLFVPLVTTTAVWGVGHLSPSYEPRFGYTLLGAFLGTVVGTAIGYAATRSMKLDLEEPNSTAPFGGVGGAIVGGTVGAMVAYHIFKKRKVAEPAPMPVSFPSPVPTRQGPIFAAPRALMFSLVSTTF